MKRVLRFVVRPAVVAPLGVVLIATSIGAFTLAGRGSPAAVPTPQAQQRYIVDPPLDRPPHQDPTPTPTPTPSPTPKPTPSKKPVVRKAATPAPVGASLIAFRRLGAWIDLYDYEAVDPDTATADMGARGVRTLYLQTGRWNRPAADSPENFENVEVTERWLHAAHAHHLRVVGWYLPAYENMSRDVRRTRAIADYRSSLGQRFDALAIDIEYKGQMPSLTAWNVAVADHARRVRRAVGATYPVAAIVPSPIAMELRPASWQGFPWQSLAAVSNVFMPMSYWSYRTGCPEEPEQCPGPYTAGNVQRVRAHTGRANVPVHVIGGVADDITTDEVADFVNAAIRVRAYGGSLYDYRTTRPEYWAHLRKLNG